MRIIAWDEPKRLSNIAKHGFDFAVLDEAFFLAAVVLPAHRNRHIAIGRLQDGTVAVVFAYLGAEGISVISMRKADKSERKLLE